MGAMIGAGYRRRGDQRGQSGFLLPMVMVFLIIGTAITLAVLGFASTSMRVGADVVEHNTERAAERDALEYALAVIRPDLAAGIEGYSQSWNVAGVAVACVGQAGSGVPAGAGRTDRVVECATPSLSVQVRFFDRSGAKAGVIEEVLRSDAG